MPLASGGKKHNHVLAGQTMKDLAWIVKFETESCRTEHSTHVDGKGFLHTQHPDMFEAVV